MFPSPLARFLAIWIAPFPESGDLFLIVVVAAMCTEFRCDSLGEAKARGNAVERHFLLGHGVGIHQPEQLLSPRLVQQGGDLLAFGFELLALLTAWFGVEPLLQCLHVVVHSVSSFAATHHMKYTYFIVCRRNLFMGFSF